MKFSIVSVLPVPCRSLRASTKIKEMRSGQVLEVQSDDEGIEKDMPAWCRMTGHEYLGLTRHGEEYHVYVKKK